MKLKKENNYTDISSYKLSKNVRINLSILGYKGKNNMKSALSWLNDKYGWIIKYKQDGNGFLGIATHKGDLLPVTIMDIDGSSFSSIQISLDKTLEVLSKLQVLKLK